MGLVKKLLLQYGGYAVWLFVIAPAFQVWQNSKAEKYMSGSWTTWALFFVASTIFGFSMWLQNDKKVAVGQFAYAVLVFTILIQSFLYVHAK